MKQFSGVTNDSPELYNSKQGLNNRSLFLQNSFEGDVKQFSEVTNDPTQEHTGGVKQPSRIVSQLSVQNTRC